MKIKFSLDQLDYIIDTYILNKFDKYTILTFKGPLGAGKSTLIRRILQRKGITEPITSPTFNYVNVYKNSNGEIFNHFDLYRLSDLQSFLGAGFDEYFYGEHKNKTWTFVEWPEIIEDFLNNSQIKNRVLKISLNYDQADLDSRFIEFL